MKPQGRENDNKKCATRNENDSRFQDEFLINFLRTDYNLLSLLIINNFVSDLCETTVVKPQLEILEKFYEEFEVQIVVLEAIKFIEDPNFLQGEEKTFESLLEVDNLDLQAVEQNRQISLGVMIDNMQKGKYILQSVQLRINLGKDHT